MKQEILKEVKWDSGNIEEYYRDKNNALFKTRSTSQQCSVIGI